MSAFSCRLPDGRQVALQGDACGLVCGGVVTLAGVQVAQGGGPAEATRVLARTLVDRYAGLLPSQIPALAEARNLYKAFGTDPSRHRPSSEALLRRVLKGEDLYRIDDAVDGCNLASLTFLLPIGMYDLARIQGDVAIRRGQSGEAYPGIRKGAVNLDGRLGLFDASGPFGSPSSDSQRTSVTTATSEILAVVMATADFPAASMAESVSIFSGIFTEHCRAHESFRAILGGRVAP